MTEAIVIGQSHTNAVAEALGARPTLPLKVYRLAEQQERVAGAVVSMADAEALVAGLSPQTVVFLSILGTYHNIIGMLRSGEAFDFLSGPDTPRDPTAAALIPYRALVATFEQNFAGVNSVRRLTAAAKVPIYLISAPPPKQSNRFMMHRFMRHKNPWYRGKSVAEAGVERPEIRLKLWQLEADLVQRWAATKGFGFLPAPTAALNEDGFLGRKYYLDDATHANAAYGALVVEQILTVLAKDSRQAANG